MGEAEPIVRFENATIGYRHHPLLSGIDLAIAAGEFVGIVGPNGGGKTTLLRTLLGLLRPLGGVVRARRPGGGAVRFGYVIQREHLDRIFPLSAFEVVRMGRTARLGLLRFPDAEDRRKSLAAMACVGIGELADRPFRDLSGGQQQRVLIARALALEPDILALDEPTNGMDIAGEGAVMDILAGLHRQGMTILLISHVLSTVMNRADRLVFIRHDPRMFRAGATADMVRPDVLAELYGTSVRVAEVGGHRVALREIDAVAANAGPGGDRPAGTE
ncbi:MAG: metal ABC transporter ATP-binding protein [Deltaproteobacteria bacterium]|nr:metal ABC transporter ATP-binding protein [Deltaproteobacteria bacterium]